MARSKGAVYSGSLKLDKVTGIRHDKGQRATPIKSLVKKDTSFKRPGISMKTVANITSDGLKKS
jgi:hypothetical protein